MQKMLTMNPIHLIKQKTRLAPHHTIILCRKALTARAVIIQQCRHERTRQHVLDRVDRIRSTHIGLQPTRVKTVGQHVAALQFGSQVPGILVDRGL